MEALPQRPKVVVLISHLRRQESLSRLGKVVQQVLPAYAEQADIQILDATLADVLQLAEELEQANRVDVFVCAGATAAYLRKRLSSPVISMRVGGRDLLRALDQARKISSRVGILSYPRVNTELDQMGPLFAVQIRQGSYTTLEEARANVERLAADGYRVVIGSSLIMELAAEIGVEGVLGLTTDAVTKALEDALAICRSKQIEVAKRQELNAVVQHMTGGIIAVDDRGHILSINPPMARLLDLSTDWALGRPLTEVAPALDVAEVLRTGAAEENRVVSLNKRTIVANIIPIQAAGVQTRVVLTCQEMTAVQRADRRIRSSTRPTQFIARYRLEDIAGASPAIHEVIRLAQRYAHTDSTVFITGESGTGKELLAQGIHNASRRRRGPFVAINCASFPESLLESELFGHEEGAFSGSRKGGKAGLFEAAHTGTVFLDEIGDMPVSLQTRLLRVLQEREVLRLGATEPTPIDIRVIAATHCDIQGRIREGLFREDLFYRLNILRLEVPPLRDRPADIPLIAHRTLQKLAMHSNPGLQTESLLEALLPYLMKYHWPGNIRELENILERAALSASEIADGRAGEQGGLQGLVPEILGLPAPSRLGKPSPFPPRSPATKNGAKSLRLASKENELAHIKEVLSACQGNLNEAARQLGISRTTLWRKLQASRTS